MDPSNPDPSFVVAIGASAGGLEAIERMFDRMPEDTGMAFVLVQHLSPDFKSLMDELLARWTNMPIYKAENNLRIERDSIYLMPPRKAMVISGGCLLLTDKDPNEGLTYPIDQVFRSLAQDYGTRSIAIVLSGTGTDGSRGIRDIHEAGGLVISQQEETARFDGMPRSARDSGAADLFMSPEEIPTALEKFATNYPIGELTSGDEGADNLHRVFATLKDSYEIDFRLYKPTTTMRRIERRIMLANADGLGDYVERVKSDRTELEMLYKDLLIGVTRFFRDPDAFRKLDEVAIERLVEEADEVEPIRIWVTACATGEEAYSIAILFTEAIERSGKNVQFKIFATEVNRQALDFAALGQYPEDRIVGISPERLDRFFTREGSVYQVSAQLRQMIVFAPHNLTKDPPFTKVNLISCRNLMIYMDSAVQQKVLSLFHFGLKTGGVLFLGPSESCGELGDEFKVLDRQWKVFEKSKEGHVPDHMRIQFSMGNRSGSSSRAPSNSELQLSTYDALLEAVMPTSLLVGDDGNLVHTFGNAGEFLQLERGRSSFDFLERVEPELQIPISAAMRRAAKEREPVTFSGVLVKKLEKQFDVTVTSFFNRRTDTRFYLVQLEEQKSGQEELPITIDMENISGEQIAAMEIELRQSKQNLQATIEELESSNEELQAANEELVASNEELQSTNEELHSVNEELYTVNAEHQNKIAQLSELTRDMEHLLESTEVHTIFLDSQLAIRKFTPRIADKFNFLPQDVGRRIFDFTHSIDCDNLSAKIQNVIATGEIWQAEVRDRGDCWFLLRILPYRATPDGANESPIDGALLTLIDISALKEASAALEESVRQRDQFLAMLSHELRNPLGTILNATHLLAGENRDVNELTTAVGVIRRQSDHMASLLADLLDVTRVSQGKIQLQKRPFDLHSAIDSAIESVRSRCDARGQILVTDFVGEEVWIYGSEPRILQVVSNLLTNASKYSPHGETIHLAVEVRNDRKAVITVTDKGVGIGPDQIDKVFEMFVQSDRTLDRADGGLGVGLTLVRSLVELHGGSVSVRSEGEGQGSEFTVELPLCEPSRRDVAAPSSTAVPTRNPGRIVLVEDSVDACKMLAFLLEDAGYEVAMAHDGLRGLEMIRERHPDTAVVDIGLPGIDGYGLARLIRKDESLDHVYLIALTGYGQNADRQEALASGFDEHLVKPVDPDLLHRLIAERNSQESHGTPRQPTS